MAKNIASTYPKSNNPISCQLLSPLAKIIAIAPAGGCARPIARVEAIPIDATNGTLTHTGKIEMGILVLTWAKVDVKRTLKTEFRGCEAGALVNP
mmetsp:Transcript_8551/g.8704  ORF Transcript_8551/g.8704 Transcript_8551/m.8704 type:complete len:95 (-) Transcript_8551:7-291(-)|eukprot:CAMPEP_0171298256 /NCGR_PEP_ID=MMETSP0816-20121228/7033_1 /TAXON_ID=420281 /ORGANISM="Proboscia inermis, Strain CCAP1064/1" /LENGTH=94 /DNA_ID=CAMNT_0011773163 /DNA_START=393 /DNA_END=677 /DNA_ORIENTATION=+